MRYFKLINGEGWEHFKEGKIYPADYSYLKTVKFYATNNYSKMHWEEVSKEEYLKQEGIIEDSVNIKSYYKSKNSLYQFAEEHELNSYEFDIIKRIVRCGFKGNWLEDLEKTKGVIDIYIKECKEKYNG